MKIAQTNLVIELNVLNKKIKITVPFVMRINSLTFSTLSSQ